MHISANDFRFGPSWLQFLKRPFPIGKNSRRADVTSKGLPSIAESVSAWAAAAPHNIAISSSTEKLTYAQLDSQSNALARHLQSLGAGPDTLVALILDRSPSLVLAALAVWKSGAAYLPLDSTWPPDRIRRILQDSQAGIIVHRGFELPDQGSSSPKLVDVSACDALLKPYSTESLSPKPKASDLAYVIYTSGSTGQPKGVEITHVNLLNLVHWHQATFTVSSSDRASLLASPGFDAAVWEIWPYLSSGATLLVPEDATRVSPRGLREWLLANSITICFAATPLAQRLLLLDWPAESALRFLLTGADTLHHHPRAGLPFTLVNNYGPTECTVVALSGTVPPNPCPSAPPSIGRPITNTRVFLLDEDLQFVARGSVGELCISGASVGRGYRNDPELTSQKFVPNPFDANDGSRLYRTGDLARALPDGSFEFVGRTDDQIKIRGFRVEPNEICAALTTHEAIQSAMVVPRQHPSGERFLAAYLLLNSGFQPTASSLRTYLQASLPDYMIPAAFVSLESFPVNTSGKIDRAALPPPTALNTLKSDAPGLLVTRTQTDLMAIVSNLLKVADINPQDNFFLLGGHSLLGAQLLSAIQRRFQIELPLRTVFDFPTIAALSSEIDRVTTARQTTATETSQHGDSHPSSTQFS